MSKYSANPYFCDSLNTQLHPSLYRDAVWRLDGRKRTCRGHVTKFGMFSSCSFYSNNCVITAKARLQLTRVMVLLFAGATAGHHNQSEQILLRGRADTLNSVKIPVGTDTYKSNKIECRWETLRDWEQNLIKDLSARTPGPNGESIPTLRAFLVPIGGDGSGVAKHGGIWTASSTRYDLKTQLRRCELRHAQTRGWRCSRDPDAPRGW